MDSFRGAKPAQDKTPKTKLTNSGATLYFFLLDLRACLSIPQNQAPQVPSRTQRNQQTLLGKETRPIRTYFTSRHAKPTLQNVFISCIGFEVQRSSCEFMGAHCSFNLCSWVFMCLFFWLPPSSWISKNTVGVLAYFSAIWLQKLCLSDQLQVPEWLFIHGLVVFGMKLGDCKTPNFWQNPSLKGTFWNKFECCATWLFFWGEVEVGNHVFEQMFGEGWLSSRVLSCHSCVTDRFQELPRVSLNWGLIMDHLPCPLLFLLHLI